MHTYIHSNMLFTIVKIQKQSKCPMTVDVVYVDGYVEYSAELNKLEVDDRHRMIEIIGGILKSKIVW